MHDPGTPARGQDDPYDRFLRSLPTESRALQGVGDVDTYRVVVATDWTNVTLPVTVARAFAAMIPATAPVTLVFSVPTAPDLGDAMKLDILLSEAAPNGGVRAVVESFADTGARPALIAFVPGGDVHVLLTEIGRGLTSLHHLTDHLRTPGAIAGSPPPRQGRMTGLAERLEQYEDLPGPI